MIAALKELTLTALIYISISVLMYALNPGSTAISEEVVVEFVSEEVLTVQGAVSTALAQNRNIENAALSGYQFTTYTEGDKNIPVMARLRVDERSELKSIYVYGITNDTKIPLIEVADIDYSLDTSRVIRRNHFRALTVIAFPAPGELRIKKESPSRTLFWTQASSV